MTIRSLQHIALAVPDPEIGRQFSSDFGLEGRGRDNTIVMRCHGRDQDQVSLVGGRTRRMHHICFGTKPELIEGAKRRLEAEGTRLLDPPNDTPADGLRFRDPDGLLTNLRAAESAPWLDAPEWRINTPGRYTRLGKHGYPDRSMAVRPRRLGHTLRFTPNFEHELDFYTRVLGMRLSDRSQCIVAFLHVAGGSAHHIFGFIAGDRPGYHHASFEVANIDEIGLGATRLIDKGYRNGWGFGRHVIGSNFFYYVRDPWNSLAEYFCDIDYIPAGMNWQATNYSPEDALYVWGPKVPDDFPVNFEDSN
jgi:catechol 2,3-dioxygenase-like lactoylglutathione lyase family enzyme